MMPAYSIQLGYFRRPRRRSLKLLTTDLLVLHDLRVLLENLTVAQMVKKFHIFYKPKRFIAVFTIPRHCSLFRAKINPVHTFQLYYKIGFLTSYHLHLGLPSGLFRSGFPTKNVYAFLLFHACCILRLHPCFMTENKT
jgi:hypothetical protein